MSGKIKLFNESDQEEPETVEFRTNKSYAKHYDEFRKKEILGQLKNYEAEAESSDSSEDETTDEEIVDAEFDKEFFKTLAFLKRKDKNKYNEQHAFFENVKPIEEVALTKRRRKEKPMTVKDYERKVILEKGGVFEDEEDDDASEAAQRAESPSLVEEEKKIKDEIKQALSKIDDEDSDGEATVKSSKGGGLLKERVKSKDETEKEQSDYIQWLTDKKVKEPTSEDVKGLEPLKQFWNNENLSKEDAFLKDYILNKRFVQSGAEIPSYDEIVATSEDEEELEKQEEYERKYNFRFEEPDTDFIKQFPRTVDDSVRVERNKRKEQRALLKERKQQEKEQRRLELDELKAVKLKEIREKIQKLKEIAATENLAMNEDDLESDFDPEEHDRRMQRMFNDEYYGVDEGDQKPEFPDLDAELGIENYDVERLDDNGDDGGYDEPHCEDDDFVMDCDFEEKSNSKNAKETLQQELLDSTKTGKKKNRRQSKFREVLKAEKPLFDPEDEKTYGEYIDEYYKLDYEDMIGDVPCRFRYVETVPNDFGLTIEEILTANTRDLNKWASVKKTVQLRPKHIEENEKNMYRRKGANLELKRKIMPSLFIESDNEEAIDEEIQKRKQEVTAQGPIDKVKAKDKTSTGRLNLKGEKASKNTKSSINDSQNHETDTSNKKCKNKIIRSCEQSSTHKEDEHESKAKLNFKNLRKRTWDHEAGTSRSQQKNASWNNRDKPHFEQNKHQNGHKNGFKTNDAVGSKRPKKEESAADQRLRAFGLNPRKFHNKQIYSKQRQTQA